MPQTAAKGASQNGSAWPQAVRPLSGRLHRLSDHSFMQPRNVRIRLIKRPPPPGGAPLIVGPSFRLGGLAGRLERQRFLSDFGLGPAAAARC